MSGKRGSSDFLSGLRVVKEANAVVRPSESKAGPPLRTEAATSESLEPLVLRTTATTIPMPRQKGREGKVSITQWVDPVVRKQIAQISLDEDKDQYELINEALNLLFEKYGRSTIA